MKGYRSEILLKLIRPCSISKNTMSIFTSIRSHAVLATTIGVVAVVVGVLAGRAATQKPAADVKPTTAKVSVVNAATFRTDSVTVSANGTVEARSQADLKSQSSAPIAVIDVSIGDRVVQGQTILELSNADIRAQLASAQASLVLAEGQYGSSRQSAIDKIRDSYNKADTAVHANLDSLISSNTGGTPPLFAYYMTDPVLGSKIRQERTGLDGEFSDWKTALDVLAATSSDQAIYGDIVLSQKNLSDISTLLNDVSTALSNALRVALPNDKTIIAGLQATVNGARDSVTAATSNLSSAQTSLSGSQSGSGSAATAQVSVAQAGVNNLQAQLDKTIIRSPISGTIAALPLREGELASPGTLLATVVGSDQSLEVKAYVSGDDLARIKTGQTATIQGTIKGTVSNISPSVDPTTKKAEVDIDIINSSAPNLIIGQNVTASIVTASASAASGNYVLPIQDVKIIPGSAFVFTVDQDSKIKSSPVTLGQIQGDFVQVTSGLNDSMDIVSPVYELDDGETVTVQ